MVQNIKNNLLIFIFSLILMPGYAQDIPKFFTQGPEEGLKEALVYYNIKHPDIVYAQAILETGHFKSIKCTKCNNLFGLYDSKNKGYYFFNHWVESVKAYKDLIQYKYKGGNYYLFLHRIGYARDKKYIDKLKNLVKRYE